MQGISLCGNWKMKAVNTDTWLDGVVPGSVYTDLLAAGRVADAYWRDNELAAAPVFEADYEYRRDFQADEALLRHDRIELCCRGIDTLALIEVNEIPLGETNNMHRTWRFDVKKALRAGKNSIRVLLKSPAAYAKAQMQGISVSQDHPPSLRKVSCMFGWDWGLSLPDSGIWRDMGIEYYDAARIRDIQILQDHASSAVNLDIRTVLETWETGVELSLRLTAPDGKILSEEKRTVSESSENFPVKIKDPELWWPAGQGEQPLYTIDAFLTKNGAELDRRSFKTGLRTIRLLREKDEYGRGYVMEVNGRRIFIKGANLVIEDAVLSRRSRAKTERMVKNCVEANFNCIRVWGGANYPEEYFYELCDAYGLLIYQDFMFACNIYPADDDFLANITEEAIQVIRQLRNHACLALWSGNNEVDIIYSFLSGANPQIAEIAKSLGMAEIPASVVEMARGNTLKLFYELIQDLVTREDPQTSYVPSSPSTEEPLGMAGFGEMPTGDSHYYLAYENKRPYPKIRELKFRFISEMGFQSYPDWKTVKAFTREEDRGPYTKVMLQHQKCHDGNQLIEEYLKADYQVPDDFEKYVYASQNIGGHIMAYSVEHCRRLAGLCMGVIAWQLNDCWPAVSWAGVDYYGRWKAQQYYLKRAFAPVLISAQDEGFRVGLYVNNDRPETVSGSVEWRLFDRAFSPVKKGAAPALVVSQGQVCAADLDFSGILNEQNKNEYVLFFAFLEDGIEKSSGNLLFVKPKEYGFQKPEFKIQAEDGGPELMLKISSPVFAKSAALSLQNADAIFSDNYFDLLPGVEKIITISKETLSIPLAVEDLRKNLGIMSAYDLQ
jgi:beta-mannosidase